jgi:cytochrome c553
MKRIIALLCGAALLTSGAAMAGNAAAGKEKAKVCAACHGADGNNPIADNPKLAGQQADYIVKSLQAYKSGTRKNPVMAPMGSNLSQRDMEDLAAFFSSQQGLTTFK